MKPTRIHYFYARDWPAKIWFAVIICMVVGGAAYLTVPDAVSVQDWLELSVLLAAVAVMGLLVGILFGWPILGTLYMERMSKNGGPFKAGDTVEILCGRHRGKVVRVYAKWQGEEVRVELSESEKKALRDIFGPHQLLKQEAMKQEACEPNTAESLAAK